MLTLPFFATQAEIVVESEPVAANATAAPPTPSASTARTPSTFLLIRKPLSAVWEMRRLPAPRWSCPSPPRTIVRRDRPGRKEAVRAVEGEVSVRAPHLYRSLRCFCLGAFSLLHQELEGGDELPFAFEEHASPGRPALYEYRPLVRSFVEARAERIAQLRDARAALDDLRAETAAQIFARAHAPGRVGADEALVRTVLLPLVTAVAEACAGFDWIDEAYDRAYLELERSLFGSERAYAAVTPLIGMSAAAPVDLGGGIRLRPPASGGLAPHGPEANALLPLGFGREPDRLCVLELERTLPAAEPDPPDAQGELADAVT